MHQAEKNKDFLISLLQPMSSSVIRYVYTCTCINIKKVLSPPSQLSSILDEQKSVLVTRYLSSEKTFSKTFDFYLASVSTLIILQSPLKFF